MLAVVHGAAALCAYAVIGGLAGAALSALILILGVAAVRERALLRGARAVRALEIARGDHATVELADGGRAPVRQDARRHISRFWVTLPTGAPIHRTVIIVSDMADPDRFRRLRLWALWGGPTGRPAA